MDLGGVCLTHVCSVGAGLWDLLQVQNPSVGSVISFRNTSEHPGLIPHLQRGPVVTRDNCLSCRWDCTKPQISGKGVYSMSSLLNKGRTCSHGYLQRKITPTLLHNV